MTDDAEVLDRLGLEAGTDKSRLRHDYLRHYDRLLQPFRELPVTLIEIGVHNGASLEMWERYFPRARIVGVEIEPSARRLSRERVEVRIGSQADCEFMAALGAELRPDIVLDDGSHVPEDQILSFKTLIPHVRPGGVYIVEDLARGGAALAFFLGLSAKMFAREQPFGLAGIEAINEAVFLKRGFADALDGDSLRLETIARASRRPSESLFFLAERVQRRGETREALRIAKEASALAPNNRWIHLLISKLEWQLGDADEAWAHARLAHDGVSGRVATAIQAHYERIKSLRENP